MADYIIAVILIMVFIGNIIMGIWTTKVNSKDTKLKTIALIQLHNELKRYNDKHEGSCEDGIRYQ